MDLLNSAKLGVLHGLNQFFRLGLPGRITLANAAYRLLRPNPSTIHVREDGVVVQLDLSNQELRCIFARAYELEEADFVRKVVKPGDTCIDVGANIGYLSAIMAAKAGKNGSVYALEADPRTLPALRVAERHAGGTIRAFGLAAGDGTTTTLEFFLAPPEHSMWSSARGKPGMTRVEVPCVSLAEFIGREKLRPQFIKIDVEGTEAAVLAGLLPYVEHATTLPTILCEMNPNAHRQQGGTTWDICEPFLRKGYRTMAWSNHNLSPVERAWIESRSSTFNLVFSAQRITP